MFKEPQACSSAQMGRATTVDNCIQWMNTTDWYGGLGVAGIGDTQNFNPL